MRRNIKVQVASVCAALLALFATVGSMQAGVAVVPLIMGQNTVVGQVEGFSIDGTLYLNITTTGSYTMDLTHVAVGETLAEIPMTHSGNPKNGKFPYGDVGGPGVQSFFMAIPLSSNQCKVPFVVAVHAMVRDGSLTDGGSSSATTAWAGGDQGIPFPGNNWATYFNVACLFSDSD